jgi:hypothetical protein
MIVQEGTEMNNKKTTSIWMGIRLASALASALVLLAGRPLYAQAKLTATAGAQDQKALLDEIAKLKAQVERLQATIEKCQAVGCPAPAGTGGVGAAQGPGQGMEPPEHGGMQGGKMKEHPMGGMGGGMHGGGMQGGGMEGGMEPPMGGTGGGAPTPMPHPPGGMGGQGKPDMGQHMDEMHRHMDQMHGGGMGTPPPASATAPPTDSSGGMGDM